MKTKIIYISGSETFEITEIRAAFEEVRETLGLDKNTILFGVPVDHDNAMTQNTNTELINEIITDKQSVLEDNMESTLVQDITVPDDCITENTFPQSPQEIIQTDESVENETDELDNEDNKYEDKKIIPILSVLAVSQDNNIENIDVTDNATDEINEENVVIENLNTADNAQTQHDINAVISDINIEAELVTPETDTQNAQKTTISDMIDDDAPVQQMEKTLEQLLESMTPLREDVQNIQEEDFIEDKTDIPIFDENNDDTTDATLAQLASEFAENEDKIPTAQKTDSHGKIGKLKNILPFKKAKRDEGGLMGDLFGWAGIAANDDDFSMPGFFTSAKKQGA